MRISAATLNQIEECFVPIGEGGRNHFPVNNPTDGMDRQMTTPQTSEMHQVLRLGMIK